MDCEIEKRWMDGLIMRRGMRSSAAVVVWSNRSLLEQCEGGGVILPGDRWIWDSVIIKERDNMDSSKQYSRNMAMIE